MPNWCNNCCEFSHSDSAEVRKLVDAYNEGKLFETFVPPPDGEWDYNWCIDNWGTKWDAGGEGWDKVSYDSLDHSIDLIFDTAWSPPIAFYTAMINKGWNLEARYYEPGMAFCGIFSNTEDSLYEITGDSAWVRENIPEELDLTFGISDSMSEYEEENAQDEP